MKLDVIKKFADALSNHNLDQISTLLYGELEVFEMVNNLKVDKKNIWNGFNMNLPQQKQGVN
jgi:hypothetical protein